MRTPIVRKTKTHAYSLAVAFFLAFAAISSVSSARVTQETLQYHRIAVDAKGQILPWNASAARPDLGRAYDEIIQLVWTFWRDMRRDANGLPYYMNHQVWQAGVNDRRGLGGDQLNMALSSWKLLYAYQGQSQGFHANDEIRDNMQFIADYYLAHSLSPPDAAWPNIPYPYNTSIYSGIYDGDMVIGRGFTQPDKAGSFGYELLDVYDLVQYNMFDSSHYLDAAVAIADTLAAKVRPGDGDRSPLPFKVHALTGRLGTIEDHERKTQIDSAYTTNWAPTLELFAGLIARKRGNVAAYQKAFDTILAWMKAYPMKTMKWGPFFEDISRWSDTQINAVTWAQYIMEHRELFPSWRTDVRAILDWVYEKLGNEDWKKYGVIAINEQTAYRVPGNSHTSRQAAAELRYAELTGDTSRKDQAIRQLSWATYMVAKDGRNWYFRDEIWLTDGYGDYVRHYLRAMAAAPELAPGDRDHILRSSTLVTRVAYEPRKLRYTSREAGSVEVVRMTAKPTRITSGAGEDVVLHERTDLEAQGWTWTPLGTAKSSGGVLRVRHDEKANVTIYK